LAVLAEVRKERGLTIIMVTHDDKVSAHADRIIHLRDGKIEMPAIETPAEVSA